VAAVSLSLITTPPIDRLAVRIFVLPFDLVVVRQAIMREHFLGGGISAPQAAITLPPPSGTPQFMFRRIWIMP
jgi:hypothetical protein